MASLGYRNTYTYEGAASTWSTTSGTPPTSTVPTAIAGLFALVSTQVAADSAAGSIVVTYGEPGMDLPPDIIQIATNVRRTVVPEALMGGYAMVGPLQETYTIDNLVSSWSGSADPVAVMNRAYVLANYIEAAVRTDPTLGTSVLEAHPGGSDGGNAQWTESPVGRLCELTVDIVVTTIN